ncbi:MAG: DNA gyrase subunit A [Methanosarcinaceae archaeon]|nr:DNA gyrase subunit A [Methanosarcinaceae archaeon]
MSEENIVPLLIQDEMKKSYIEYAMSVIIGRALPDARDGLKPVHRRILYSMKEAGMTYDKAYKKSARVVGDVLGKYHPHGDSAVYDSLVRMVQDFSLRYPLIDGQGNFGSIDGDSAAAMRYTEIRLKSISNEMLADIDRETVDFRPNYDGSLKEPVVLPARLPNLLINGSTGIAVGMATNMPPHNLGEVIDATMMLMKEPNTPISELMSCVKGPDFPTAGIIAGTEGIKSAYETGRGKVIVRAVTNIEEMKGDKHRIIVTELPYQVNKSKLIENIASLVREKKVIGVSDLRDESDRDGIRVVVELTRNTNSHIILNQLYKHTQMQTTFGIINLTIKDGVPKVLNLHEILTTYLEHRINVIQKKSIFLLNKAESRAHILEGLRIALDNIDRIVALIKGSNTTEIAKIGLIENFSLSEIQAKAILEMRLQRLTGLEGEKIDNEYKELIETIADLKDIIQKKERKFTIISEELIAIKEKYADARRTKITMALGDMLDENLIQKEEVVVTITNHGYIKRLPLDTYSKQHRGGKGIIGMDTKENDFVKDLFVSSTHDYLLFFTNEGRVYVKKVYEIGETSRTSKGKAIINLLELKQSEKVTAMIPVCDFSDDQYLVLSTKFGTIKKTSLSDFSKVRKTGIVAITLRDSDELVSVLLTDGNKEIMLASKYGKAVCFKETDVRSMGRTARGVRGINLERNDAVVGMDLVMENATLLTITENGYGKRTKFEEYRKIKRGGKGVITIITNNRNGFVMSVKTVFDTDGLILTSSEGVVIRMSIKDIRVQGRNTQGVKIMNMKDDDKVVGVARVKSDE